MNPDSKVQNQAVLMLSREANWVLSQFHGKGIGKREAHHAAESILRMLDRMDRLDNDYDAMAAYDIKLSMLVFKRQHLGG